MIKMIAFDLVGVLLNEKDIVLTEVEEKLERKFGPNLNDTDYITFARDFIDKDEVIVKTTEELIFKLYKEREQNLFEKIKKLYPKIKIIIASNHLSYVRNYLVETFDSDFLEDIIISAEIGKIKPNFNFYEHILDKYNLKPKELLFLDDNIDNVVSADKLGIKTIKVDKETVLSETVLKFIENDK